MPVCSTIRASKATTSSASSDVVRKVPGRVRDDPRRRPPFSDRPKRRRAGARASQATEASRRPRRSLENRMRKIPGQHPSIKEGSRESRRPGRHGRRHGGTASEANRSRARRNGRSLRPRRSLGGAIPAGRRARVASSSTGEGAYSLCGGRSPLRSAEETGARDRGERAAPTTTQAERRTVWPE